MPETEVNGVRIYHELHGEGDPIACVHGTGGSALMWGEAIEGLSRLGRVIAYDRRGCTRSGCPDPYESTCVADHTDDLAALLDGLDAAPAVVIGRSYGGAIAIDLALRYPDMVRALVLLEPADVGLSAMESEWMAAVRGRMRDVAAEAGIDAVGEAFIGEVLGEGAWGSLPEGARQMFTQNGKAILAELEGESLGADAAALRTIDKPTLLVAATDSPIVFRESTEATAGALRNAGTAFVDGSHLIDPAATEVLTFIDRVLAPS